MTRAVFLVLGLACVALGFVGVFVPLMPTTIFLILAAACFTRSSPRLERWLLEHGRFGPLLKAWREYGAIPPRAKALAAAGILAGYGVFWWQARPGALVAAAVAAALGGVLLFVLTRPNGPHGGAGASRDRDAA